MENFGEIIINPEGGYPQEQTPTTPQIPEHKAKERESILKEIVKADTPHENKKLSKEAWQKRLRNTFIGISVIAFSAGALNYKKNQETAIKKPTAKISAPSGQDLHPLRLPQEVISENNKHQPSPEKIITDSDKALDKLRTELSKSYLEKTESKAKEQKITPTKNEKPSKENLEKAHNLAIEIQAISRNLLKNDEFFPKKIFSADFLLAIQAQESSFDKGATSHKGAVGSMQVMPNTLKETLQYLNLIDKRFSFEPKDLTPELIDSLIYTIKQNPELGQAFGNLYLAEIFNKFEIGQKSLENNWIGLGRKKILAVYNWGIGKFMRNATNEESWPLETKTYIENIFSNQEIFKKINKQLGIDENNKKIESLNNKKTKKSELITIKNNPRIIKEIIISEIRKFRDDKKIDYSKINLDAMITHYLKEIQIKEAPNKNPLKKEVLEKIVKDLNPKLFKEYVAEEGLIAKKSSI